MGGYVFQFLSSPPHLGRRTLGNHLVHLPLEKESILDANLLKNCIDSVSLCIPNKIQKKKGQYVFGYLSRLGTVSYLTIKILHKEAIGVVYLDLTSVKFFCCLLSSFSKPGSPHPLQASYGNKVQSFTVITLRQIVSF